MEPTVIIDIEALRFGWKPGELVLDIDSLAVEAGSRVFVEGPSGCGKSTLLNVLGGVVTALRGRVSVLGSDLSTMGRAARDRFRADHIGFIFQQFNLIPYLDVLENVTLPARFSPARRRRIAARGGTVRAEAERLLADLGMSVADAGGRRAAELSVGQQQRVAAARALLGSPEIVIADEPTSSLDAHHRRVFLELLETECGRAGATLVFVSHDVSLAPLFDRRISLPGINAAAREFGDSVP